MGSSSPDTGISVVEGGKSNTKNILLVSHEGLRNWSGRKDRDSVGYEACHTPMFNSIHNYNQRARLQIAPTLLASL